MSNNNNNFKRNIGFLLPIIMAVVAAVWAVGTIKTDIAVIKQRVIAIEENHLANIVKSIDDIIMKNDEQDDIINEINLKMAELLSYWKQF